MKDKSIKIEDWTGKLLFIGPYDDPKVDQVLDANRCKACNDNNIDELCPYCDDTGYSGDFSVFWIDDANDDLNVYEYINY